MEKENVILRFKSFLNSLDRDEKKALWAIMTAFRGPDDGDEQLKDKTTSVIRSYFFKKSDQFCCPFQNDGIFFHDIAGMVNFKDPLIFPCEYTTTGHFEMHITQAINVLRKYKVKRGNKL